MHFLEDALENIEGLPEEVKRRCEQIRVLDRDVERLQLEKQMMEKQLFGTDGSKDEKQDMCIEIMEKYAKMRELANEKVIKSQRLALLLRRLSEKTREQQEFFKCELEVDDAGCTGPIESRFLHQLEMIRSGKAYVCESDDSARCSPVEGIVPCNSTVEPKPIFKERNGKGRPPKSAYYTGEDGKKYRKKVGKDGQMSTYMRKKREKMREQQKMLEVHARREEERRRNELSKSNAQVPQIDLASFCAQAGGPIPQPSRGPSATPSGDQDDAMSWTGGLADMLGSDDDFDPIEALDLFPSMLPSPPREIMDALGEDSMFGLDDDMTSGLGGSSDSRSPMYPPSFDHSMASGPSSPIKMPPPQSFLDTPGSEKRKKLTFGSTSDTSIHGRPRKLTDRAAEAVQQTNEKLKKREEVVQHQMSLLQTQQQQSQEDKEKWCFCRQGSYGTMIACESSNCRYEWFHLDCLNMQEAPTGDWYCPDCISRARQ